MHALVAPVLFGVARFDQLRENPEANPPHTQGRQSRPVRLWSFSDASLAQLLSFVGEGLFVSPVGPDGWLEDLTTYRGGELVLGLVTQEQEGVLRLTQQEHADVAGLDIPSELAAEWIGY
jgi:hypothetical protein